MESNEQTKEELRYYHLNGEAKIEKVVVELVKVTLISDDNPNRTPLHFDFILEDGHKITAEAFPEEGILRNVDFTAKFDEKWFNITKNDRFVFRKDDNSLIQDFTGLREPTAEDNEGDMSRVKPGA